MRILTIALSFLLALTLTACGNEGASGDDTASADTAAMDAPDVSDATMDIDMPEVPTDEMTSEEDAVDEDPAAAWQRDMVDYGNAAYATRERAILKIDDAVYLDEGQTAWLVRQEDERVHFLWTMEEPDSFALSMSYTGDTAPMIVRGQTDADALIRQAMSDMDVDLPGLGIEYDMLRYHEDHESYVIEEGVQLTAYPAQLEPGKTGLRATVFNDNNPAAAHFEGLRFYDYNPEMVIEANFTPLDEFVPTVFQTSRGWYKEFYHMGDATFSVDGQTMVMPMYGFVTEPAEVDVMSAFFTDANAGSETYGVGRYMDVELEAGGFPPATVTLDFNYAYNPNCARSSYYNCPVAEYDIPVAIRAGEMIPEGH